MKRYMKIICVMLAVVLVSAFIGGCNSNGLEKLNLDEGKKTKKLSPDSITVYLPGYIQAADQMVSNYSSYTEMFEELNKKTMKDFSTEIKLEWLPTSYTNYDDDLIKVLESGNAPDAFWTGNVRKLHENGLIKDITKLFPQYAPKYYTLLKESWGNEAKDAGVEFDNKLYAILNNDLRLPRSCVVVSKDLAERYAPDGISTLEDYGRFMKAVKENEKDSVPGYIELSDFLDTYLGGNGYFNELGSGTGFYCSWKAKDLTPIPAEKVGEFRTACNLYKQWDEGKLLLNVASGKDRQQVIKGKLVSTLINGSSLHSYNSRLYLLNSEYSVYPLYLEQPYIRTRPNYSIGIYEGSSKADRVLMFIEWLQGSQENYDLFMYGIKDKNYRLNGNRLDTASQEINSVAGWLGSDTFRNYVYERPLQYEPDNYKDFQEKCFFDNTMPISDVFKKFGYDSKKYNNQTAKQNNNYIKEDYIKRNKIYSKFLEQWKAGNFTKTLDDFINEGDGKSSTERLLEAFTAELKELKK